MSDHTGAEPDREQQPFRAVLMPHRSLPPAGFMIVMALLGGISFTAGVAFLWIGAWPVLGFFGLDLLLVYFAFKLNYRSGRLRELVEIDDGELRVTRIHPSGRRERFSFQSAWVRVNLREEVDGRTELSVSHHARALVFGRFLTDDERRDFSEALRGALVTARGGPRI